MSWFANLASQAIQFADGLADNIVAQANAAQSEMVEAQNKIKEEEAAKKRAMTSSVTLPWETEDESKAILSHDLMEQILQLSLAERNFSISPSDIDVVEFSFDEFVPVAMRLISLDVNLARVHAKLVPKMNEELFWRNYYFRIVYLRAKIGMVQDARFNFTSPTDETIVYSPDSPALDVITPNPATEVEPNKQYSVSSKPMSNSASTSPQYQGKGSSSKKPQQEDDEGDDQQDEDSTVRDAAAEEEARKREEETKHLQDRIKAEAELAAEVEAELDNEDLDLEDLDLDDMDGEFESYKGVLEDAEDDELEAQIAKELEQRK